jgi:GxxExxY protein
MGGHILHKELSYKIYGLLFETQNILGRFKNEKQYGDYFEFLLQKNKIKYLRESVLDPSFMGEKKRRNICDFIIEDKIIIEFKTMSFLDKDAYFQLKRYLSCRKIDLGILVNFRQKYLVPKRVLNGELLINNK